MTTTVERPQPLPVSSAQGASSRWVSQWRVALRLARRDIKRARGQALLVVLLVALPIAAVTGVDLYVKANPNYLTANALADLGSEADAMLAFSKSTSIEKWQSYTASSVNDSLDGKDSTPTVDKIRATLPAGSRLVSAGGFTDAVIESGVWGINGGILLQDLSDPLLAGLWTVTSGTLPTAATEIALNPDDAQRLRVGVGDSVAVTTLGSRTTSKRLTVVGLASGRAGASAVARPDSLPEAATGGSSLNGFTPNFGPYAWDPTSSVLFVDSPRDLTWADVRALNKVGVVATSRAVLTNPPSFCTPDQLCGDAGPLGTDGYSSSNPPNYSLLAVVATLIALQIGLLAAPAFAVSLRRRQRELGLLGSVGADPSAIRRTMLASGLVLGTVGALIGVGVGWAIAMVVVIATRTNSKFTPLEWPGFAPEVLAFAAFGVFAGLVAALIPATTASRTDVTQSLRGLTPPAPPKRSQPVAGLALVGLGIGGMFYGGKGGDATVLILSILCAELGLILIIPSLIVALGTLGQRLPVAARLAVRDAGRHRLRTTAAACAIAMATGGAIATAAWQSSNVQGRSSADQRWAVGTIVTPIVPSAADWAVTPASVSVMRDVKTIAQQALPDAIVSSSTEVYATSSPVGSGSAWTCVLPKGGADKGSPDTPCPRRDGLSPNANVHTALEMPSIDVAAIDEPSKIATWLGPLAPNEAAQTALREGKALVSTGLALDGAGNVTLRAHRLRSTDAGVEYVAGELVKVPALVIPAGAVPAPVIVGPAALAPGMPLHGRVSAGLENVVVSPTSPDTADRPTAFDRVTIAYVKNGYPGLALEFTDLTREPYTGDLPLVLALAAGATLIVALFASLMITALALAEGRADFATLAAVGAQPATRRRIAASTAAFVTIVGGIVGAVSGLIIGRLLNSLVNSDYPNIFVVPWLMLAVTLIGIPALTGVLAWLFTRSRVVMVRRVD